MAHRILFYSVVSQYSRLRAGSAGILLGRQKRTAGQKTLEHRREGRGIVNSHPYLNDKTGNLKFQIC